MSTLHFGYERDTEHALRTILGDDFWTKHLSLNTHRPYADQPTDYGAIESRPIERIAVVIEGEREAIAPYLEAIQNVREATK